MSKINTTLLEEMRAMMAKKKLHDTMNSQYYDYFLFVDFIMFVDSFGKYNAMFGEL